MLLSHLDSGPQAVLTQTPEFRNILRGQSWGKASGKTSGGCRLYLAPSLAALAPAPSVFSARCPGPVCPVTQKGTGGCKPLSSDSRCLVPTPVSISRGTCSARGALWSGRRVTGQLVWCPFPMVYPGILPRRHTALTPRGFLPISSLFKNNTCFIKAWFTRKTQDLRNHFS